MINFGAGVLVATPQLLADGTIITVPSPVQFGILQEVTVDEEFESKPLHGANQYPVAVGRGKGKVSLKAKAALINAELYNSAFYGLTVLNGYEAIAHDLVGTVIAGTGASASITPTPAVGSWVNDLGVRDGAGNPFIRVVGPQTGLTGGQYSLSGGTGVYSFSDIDAAWTGGTRVFIDYVYGTTTAPTGRTSGRRFSVINQPMGYQPRFTVDLQTQYAGKTFYVRYPNVVGTKLSRTAKNDDWLIPEFDMEAFADDNDVISYLWAYE